MAKEINNIFRVIEGKASDFTAIGMGVGGGINESEIEDGIFGGFSLIEVEGGGFIVCDMCNDELKSDETCYYVAVLNYIICKKCFDHWIASAKYYQEDSFYEQRNFSRVKKLLEDAGVWQDK